MPKTSNTNNDMQRLFKIAVDKKASDLHLAASQPPILRINGNLTEIAGEQVLTGEGAQNLALSILTAEQKEKFIKERELDLSYEIAGLARFRVNLHWEKDNVGLAARVINEEAPTMASVLMPPIAYDLVRLNDGLILVTGPTGSGKSTTLAAMINLIDSEKKNNIIVLEDPIEFIFHPKQSIIKQRELGKDILTFESGLKHALRQDPDVIMVGEMRDLETIATTMTLAETGHLVLATLHTIDAAQTVDRIIDVFPPHQQDQIRVQLSLSLRGVISQRLLPAAKGGLLAAREIMINMPAIANLIRENKVAQIRTVIQTSAGTGMVTMDQDIKRLFKEGKISEEIARAHMIDPSALEL